MSNFLGHEISLSFRLVIWQWAEKKICKTCLGENAEKCINYTENTLSRLCRNFKIGNKIDKYTFQMCQTTVKRRALQTLTQYLHLHSMRQKNSKSSHPLN